MPGQDQEPGQIVPYRRRSRKTLEETSRVLNLETAPTGVAVATPASGQIWTRITTRRRRGGRSESHGLAITDGMVFAGLGLLGLYELDKYVSAWAGNIGADLQGLNPVNWVTNGLNAQSAMAAVKAAAAAAAAAPPPTATSPPVPSPPSSSGSNVGYVAGQRVGASGWDQLWASMATTLERDFRQHRLEVPPAA